MFVSEDNISEKFARLRLIRSEGIGPVSFSKFLQKHKSAENAVNILSQQTSGLPKNFKLASIDSIETERQKTLDFGAKFIFRGEKRYPESLNAIPAAPPVIVVKGNEALFKQNAIGIVGARNASAAGQKITTTIAQKLSQNSIVVVSGLARGIDTAAHKASVAKGTIACLAGGIDIIYPPENDALYNEIKANGLLISEMPIGTEPKARHFPRRNRIISGLSNGLLVVEAARKSGSLISARFAAEQGRDVYAVPGSPLDPRAQGTNQLIKDGAILTQSAEDILVEMQSFKLLPKHIEGSTEPKKLQPISIPVEQKQPVKQHQLLEYLSHNPIHIDEIVRLSGHSSQDLMGMFFELELNGDIIRHSGGKYSLSISKN